MGKTCKKGARNAKMQGIIPSRIYLQFMLVFKPFLKKLKTKTQQSFLGRHVLFQNSYKTKESRLFETIFLV